jgi:hypothetical protein
MLRDGTKWTDALIAIPPLVERPSGLLVPSDSGRPTVVGDGSQFADGTRISNDALMVMPGVPSSFEQMRVVVDESGVGLPVSSRDQLRSLVSKLSFENTMLAIARLASHTARAARVRESPMWLRQKTSLRTYESLAA